MKKTFKSIISVLLCVCMVLSAGITGAAVQNTAAQPAAQNYASVEDYIAQSKPAGANTAATGKTAGAQTAETLRQ